jgi:hypothetical protein
MVAVALSGCQRESDSPIDPGVPAIPLEESVADDELNVVLITLDTTRADALGSYGQRLPVSPNFDRLAKRVTDGMSQPRPDFLDTLASAYAAVGDFASAVRVQNRVLHLIEGIGDAEQIENARDHLAHFEAGRPLREPESGD